MEDSSSNPEEKKTIAIKLGDVTFLMKERTEEDCICVENGVKVLPLPVNSNRDNWEIAKKDHRDISIAVLRSFLEKRKQERVNSTEISKPHRILQALSGTGLAALRYAHEVEGVNEIVALNEDKAFFQVCQRNLKRNNPEASAKVVPWWVDDASLYMYKHPKTFDVVDLDPMGSPHALLNSAVWATVDGGLLMCSASDVDICKKDAQFAYSKYHSVSFPCDYNGEMVLRILLACIERHANMYGRYVEPLFSVYLLYDVRVFVRIYSSESSKSLSVKTPQSLSYVYQCDECPTFHLQPLVTPGKDEVKNLPGYVDVDSKCKHCGGRFFLGGPIWAYPYFQHEWVQLISQHLQDMNNKHRVEEELIYALSKISKELSVPFFLDLDLLRVRDRLTYPDISTEQFKKAIEGRGYNASGTHINDFAVKTDAPMHVIWDVMGCWVKSQARPVEVDCGTEIEPMKKKIRDVDEDLES